jgi:hypothetical protein
VNKILLTGGTGCIGAAASHGQPSRGVDEVLIATGSGAPASPRFRLGKEVNKP